jgi:hypothetical protein
MWPENPAWLNVLGARETNTSTRLKTHQKSGQ